MYTSHSGMVCLLARERAVVNTTEFEVLDREGWEGRGGEERKEGGI